MKKLAGEANTTVTEMERSILAASIDNWMMNIRRFTIPSSK